MSVVTQGQTISKFSKAKDAKAAIIEAIGDLSSLKVMQNMILVATFIRSEKTTSGLYLPESALDEDVWQGKVGLVLKLGPVAFTSEGEFDRFAGVRPSIHDWCVYRVGDAWDLTLRKVPCRLVADHNVRLVINDPEEIF